MRAADNRRPYAEATANRGREGRDWLGFGAKCRKIRSISADWASNLMEQFAALIDALVYTRSRNEKLRLIGEYLRATPDPDRGWALAALSDGLDFPAVKSSTIRNILKERVDPVLWTLSRDFVGDTAETASLLWPQPDDPPSPPSVSETVELLQGMTRKSALVELPALLDQAREADIPVAGLMCIPPFEIEPTPFFALLDKLARDHGLEGRSMGMSGDYETAVKLGATHVRVGTALFGKRG